MRKFYNTGLQSYWGNDVLLDEKGIKHLMVDNYPHNITKGWEEPISAIKDFEIITEEEYIKHLVNVFDFTNFNNLDKKSLRENEIIMERLGFFDKEGDVIKSNFKYDVLHKLNEFIEKNKL